MSSKVFKFLKDYVGVYTRVNTPSTGNTNNDVNFKTDKMSYKDFYAMLRDLQKEVKVKKPSAQDDNSFNAEHINKYTVLMDKLNYKRLPLNLKQGSIVDNEVVMTLEIGNENQHFMTNVYDKHLGFVRKPLDKKSVYIVVVRIGFTRRINEKSIVRPNSLNCESVYRKNINVVGGKRVVDLEEVQYLKGKLQNYLDDNINNKTGSKIKVVRDALLNDSLDIESVLRFVTDKELRNIEFKTRMNKSIEEQTPINWEGLTYK